MLRIQKIIGIERHFSLAAFKYAGHNKFERVGLDDGELFADKKSVLVHAVAIQENGRRKNVQIFLNVFDEYGKRSNNYDMRLELPLILRGMAAV
mgnify:CR=1 FL=1